LSAAEIIDGSRVSRRSRVASSMMPPAPPPVGDHPGLWPASAYPRWLDWAAPVRCACADGIARRARRITIIGHARTAPAHKRAAFAVAA